MEKSENRSHVLVCKKWSVMCARMEGVQKVRTGGGEGRG